MGRQGGRMATKRHGKARKRGRSVREATCSAWAQTWAAPGRRGRQILQERTERTEDGEAGFF
jgi:hypothetical protein